MMRWQQVAEDDILIFLANLVFNCDEGLGLRREYILF